MNTEDFISSGIMEAYVMGATTDAESQQVLDMAARYPEIKAELEAIENAMNAYALKHSIEPPSYLKEKVLAKITGEHKESGDSSNHKEFKIGPQSGNKNTPKRYGNIFAIAASLALLVSLPLNIYLYSKVSSNESKISAMNVAQKQLSKAMLDSAAAYQGIRNELYVLTDPMFKMVKLSGQKATPDAKAMVCWCPDSKELYFSSQKLPSTPKGMQYELWAIVDGKPVNAGMVNMDTIGMQKMKLIANATAFAVTLEKEGGSDMPHGDMVVMGAI